MWTQSGTPDDSIEFAVMDVGPQTRYLGLFPLTTAPVQGPVWIPILMWRSTSYFWRG
jgi:hypothetical protein